jgi:hypothetical protein
MVDSSMRLTPPIPRTKFVTSIMETVPAYLVGSSKATPAQPMTAVGSKRFSAPCRREEPVTLQTSVRLEKAVRAAPVADPSVDPKL